MLPVKKSEEVSSIVFKNAVKYAEEVVLHRYFPCVIDGLRESQRALLYTLWLETRKKADKITSLTLCGMAFSRHPHNDVSIYKTLVGLVCTVNPNVSLISPGGSFYSRIDNQTTKPRYNFAGLSELGKEFFSTKDYVELKDSPAGDAKVPVALKPRFPYGLFVGYINIPYGINSCVLPFNAIEIMRCMRYLVLNEYSFDAIYKIFKGPDLYRNQRIFISRYDLRNLFEKGYGKATVVCDVDVNRKTGEIRIKEIPYKSNGEDFYNALRNAIEEGLNDVDGKDSKAIHNVDLSSLAKIPGDENTSLVFSFKVKNLNKLDETLKEVYNRLSLKKQYSLRLSFKTPDEEKIDLYSIKEILEYYIDFNKFVIKNDYLKKIASIEAERDKDVALELITREENRELFKEAIFKRNKREILVNAGIESKYVDLILKLTIDSLSEREAALSRLHEYDEQLNKIREKLSEENLKKETIEYIDKILGLLGKYERNSEVIVIDSSNKGLFAPVKEAVVRNNMLEDKNKNIILTDVGFISSNASFRSRVPFRQNIRVLVKCNSSDTLIFVTKNDLFKVPVELIVNDYVSANNYISSKDIVQFIFTEKAKDNDIDFIFVTEKGRLKKIASQLITPLHSHVDGINIDDDDYIVRGFAFNRNKNMNNYVIETITRDGYFKRFSMSNFDYKSKRSSFYKITKFVGDDLIVDARLIDSRDIEQDRVSVISNDKIIEVPYDFSQYKITNYTVGLKLDVSNVIGFYKADNYVKVLQESNVYEFSILDQSDIEDLYISTYNLQIPKEEVINYSPESEVTPSFGKFVSSSFKKINILERL